MLLELKLQTSLSISDEARVDSEDMSQIFSHSIVNILSPQNDRALKEIPGTQLTRKIPNTYCTYTRTRYAYSSRANGVLTIALRSAHHLSLTTLF